MNRGSITPSCHRLGFTILEVMVALGLLGTTAGMLITVVGQQNMAIDATEQRREASYLAESLAQRISTARWEWLGTDRLPWSYGRYTDGSGHPPMSLQASNADDNLLQLGLLPGPSRADNLHVWVEWYRAIDATSDSGILIAGEEGLLDVTATTTDEFRKNIRQDTTNPESPIHTRFRPGTGGLSWPPGGTSALSAYVIEGQPLAAHIVVSWGRGIDRNGDGDMDDIGDMRHTIELYVGRRE